MKIFFLIICTLAFATGGFCQIVFEQVSEQERLQADLRKQEFAKKEILYFKSFYLRKDTALTAIQALSDSTFIKLVDALDRLSPEAFYQKSAALFSEFKINQAAFLRQLGQLRLKYYNVTDPHYSASGGGALLMALDYALAEPMHKYLKLNIDNYIEILNRCIEWHTKHDYVFVTENKDTIKYNQLTKDLIVIRDNYLQNKAAFQQEGMEEANAFIKNANDMLPDIEKQIKRIKKQLKQLR